MTPEERLAQAMTRGAPQPPAEDRTWRNVAAAGELALGALPFTRLGRAMLSTLPRAAGTGLGAGAAIEGARGNLIPAAEASDQVRQLQRQLKDAGYYRGPIDGNMGPATQEAKRAFDAAQQATGQQEIERQRAEAERALAAAKAKGAEAEARAAEAKLAETERLRQEAERRAREREEGGARLRELDERPLSRVMNAMLAVGPYAGLGLGYGIGHKLQGALSRRAGNAAQAAADQADAVMARRVGTSDIPGRVGRVNRFWSEGHPSGAEPFTFEPGRAPARAPYVPNTAVPPAGALYRPTARGRALEAAPVPLAGGAEHITAELTVSGPARRELAAAQQAVADDPSEANILRLQVARARAALGEATSRIGWGIGAGSGVHSLVHALGSGARARPALLQQAEKERGRLVQILSRPPPPRRKKKG